MNVRDQSNEKPRRVELLAHPRGAGVDPLARRQPVLDRPELGRQAERVEAERVEHRVAAGAPEAGVGVADRVAADVAHVRGARGERVAVEDVHVLRGPPRLGRRLERVRVSSRPAATSARSPPGRSRPRGKRRCFSHLCRLLTPTSVVMRPTGIEPASDRLLRPLLLDDDFDSEIRSAAANRGDQVAGTHREVAPARMTCTLVPLSIDSHHRYPLSYGRVAADGDSAGRRPDGRRGA